MSSETILTECGFYTTIEKKARDDFGNDVYVETHSSQSGDMHTCMGLTIPNITPEAQGGLIRLYESERDIEQSSCKRVGTREKMILALRVETMDDDSFEY